MLTSYAQNGEDVILKRIFGDQQHGFYIDVGASHPDRLSVTKAFYDAGWSGINIDPLKSSIELFNKARPRDINLNVAIALEDGTLNFHEVPDYPELSTFAPDQALLDKYSTKSYQVETLSGTSLFSKFVKRDVDFMKIDVEGAEFDVIRSINFKLHRPKVLVIEATTPNALFPGWLNFSSVYNFAKWEPLLLESGYLFAYFDGLNRFYVRQENRDLLVFFAVGLCLWDNFISSPHAQRISELQWHCDERMRQIEELSGLVRQPADHRATGTVQIQTLALFQELSALLQRAQLDRVSRDLQIETLTELLKNAETDRTARGKQVETLTLLQKDAETERILESGHLEDLTQLLKQAEVARTLKDAEIEAIALLLKNAEIEQLALKQQLETARFKKSPLWQIMTRKIRRHLKI